MNGLSSEILASSVHPLGFEIRKTRYDMPECPSVELDEGFTPSGDYLGDVESAEYLYEQGIAPEKASPDHCVCSIGFCAAQQKWAGWSHRAMAYFGLGDRLYEPDYGGDDTPFVERGSRVITTLGEARQAAVAFAASVS